MAGGWTRKDGWEPRLCLLSHRINICVPIVNCDLLQFIQRTEVQERRNDKVTGTLGAL